VGIVSFTDDGPRVAELDVTVESGEVVLREPVRVLIGSAGLTEHLLDADAGHRVPTAPLGLDVEAILDRWEVEVLPSVELDTGPATPIQMVRAHGAAIHEVLYVDRATGIAVRRETRDAEGDVLRVVAYTWLHAAPHAADGSGDTAAHAETHDPSPDGALAAQLAAASEHGFVVDRGLGAGFELVAVRVEESMAVARYGDGLSVLSIYQQHGSLDADALEGAAVRHVAGRDVFSWPGREPVRYVWTGDDRTWIAVSDAPAPVIEGALASLPGDLVGHDAPHRLRRGLDRVWDFLTAPLR
jgi:hypothetical protein